MICCCCSFLVSWFADAIIQMTKIDEMTKEEANNLREVIDTLHAKHKEYTVGIQNSLNECLQDQSDIKRLAGLWNVPFSFVLNT